MVSFCVVECNAETKGVKPPSPKEGDRDENRGAQESAFDPTDVEIRFDEVMALVSGELKKNTNTIAEDFGAMIEGNENVWVDLINFKYTNEKYDDERYWRQDVHEFGMRPSISEEDLQDISLNSSQIDWDASKQYDYMSYMTEVLIRGHLINGRFKELMDGVFGKKRSVSFGKSNAYLHFGPIKGHDRCVMKAEMEYAETR